MIVITGAIEAPPAALEELIEAAIAHSTRSRAEPGCISHNVHIDCENPLRLFFYEQWADRAAVETHFKVPESIEFVRTIRRVGAKSTGAQICDSTPVQL